jgi:hypothetical protein
MELAAPNVPADLVGTSIMVRGKFDPLILQPSRLIENGLLDESDVSDLRYDVLTPDIAIAVLSWMKISVERDKILAASTLKSPAGEPVRDFFLGFLDIMPVKVCTALGINHERHFPARTEDLWHEVGHALAPKEAVWSKVMEKPGLLSLTIQGERQDEQKGKVNVKVEPSARIKPGIYVQINDHYDADGERLAESPDHVLVALTEKWDQSIQMSDRIVAAVKELAK